MSLIAWKRTTEWPLSVLAVLFLLAYAREVIGNLSGPAAMLPEVTMDVIWTAFAVDYVVSLILARPKRRWFLTHLHELVVVALPVLRPLRLLRLLSVVLMLHRGSVWAFRGRIALYVATTSGLLILVAGIAVLDAEQNAPHANIRQIGDAWWWACTTLTTVGYGDFFPVTFAGRLVAVALMAAGVGVAERHDRVERFEPRDTPRAPRTPRVVARRTGQPCQRDGRNSRTWTRSPRR